jgi:hypothetical protein
MAGYSTKSLVEKLGLKPHMRYLVRNPPAGFFDTLGPLPEGVRPARAARGTFDFIHAFYEDSAAYEADLPKLRALLVPEGTLWISWRKGGAKAQPPTDLTEAIVRDRALRTDLVDVKIAAVDERWSGLKLMVRLSARPARAAKR